MRSTEMKAALRFLRAKATTAFSAS